MHSSPSVLRPLLFRTLSFFLLLLLFLQPSSSQDVGPVAYTARATSGNHRYRLTVTGKWCDDVPCGPQRVRLTRGGRRILWTKSVRKLSALPSISNLGDVAIATGKKVTFYSRTGKRKGERKAPEGFQNDLFEMIQAYSTNGKRYYVVTGSPPDSLWFVTLSDSGREVHRESLTVLHPCIKDAIRMYKDRVMMFDCGESDYPKYGRACCVFNADGTLIWEYDEERHGRRSDKAWDVTFNARNGLLTIVDGEKKERVKVDTLR